MTEIVMALGFVALLILDWCRGQQIKALRELVELHHSTRHEP